MLVACDRGARVYQLIMPATNATQQEMVERQLMARGIRDEAVLHAMTEVPREAFVPHELVEFAYADTPLPIDESQTISQPYIVALMLESLELQSGDNVLDVGTGSGYAAAVASRIATQVYGIERHASLAHAAAERCRGLGYDNVHIRTGDGTRGSPENAPFDAIMVAAGGPKVPEALKQQLAIGGRLVIPIGATPRVQTLLRVRRTAVDRWEEEDLGAVAFVPLIGDAGWPVDETPLAETPIAPPPRTLPDLLARHAERFDQIADVDPDPFLDRAGDARVVCLGEASHGTAEFYQMRARLTP